MEQLWLKPQEVREMICEMIWLSYLWVVPTTLPLSTQVTNTVIRIATARWSKIKPCETVALQLWALLHLVPKLQWDPLSPLLPLKKKLMTQLAAIFLSKNKLAAPLQLKDNHSSKETAIRSYQIWTTSILNRIMNFMQVLRPIRKCKETIRKLQIWLLRPFYQKDIIIMEQVTIVTVVVCCPLLLKQQR